MSLSDLMQSDIDDVFFSTDDFAESILRFVGGERGTAEYVTAIVTWHPTDAVQDRGRANRRTGEIFLKDAQSVTVKDVFKVGNDTLQVTAVGQIQDGARTVQFSQYISETKGATSLRTGDL